MVITRNFWGSSGVQVEYEFFIPHMTPTYTLCRGYFSGKFYQDFGIHLTPTYTPRVVQMLGLPPFPFRLAQFLR